MAYRNWSKLAKIATIPNNEFVIAIECLRIMEATSTFTLPNQFSVWVGKKIFAQSDLDLVLTEYYKKRLESRLKNRGTHTNEKNSIESIVLSLPTHLPIPSNWVLTSKPSSLRPPFPLLTPPPSLLSLPSQLTQSIPSTSCHKNITYLLLQPYVIQPAFSTSDLPSSFFTSTSIQGIIPEIIAANTPILGNTSIDPQFQAPYVTPMPYPGVPGSPFFEEPMSTSFWKDLRICVMTTKWSLLRKSADYLGIVRCLPLAMLDL